MFGLCIVKKSTINEAIEVIEEYEKSTKEAADCVQDATRKLNNFHTIVCEVMSRPEYKDSIVQSALTEVLCRAIEGLTKEQWDRRLENIRKFFEEGATLDFDDM